MYSFTLNSDGTVTYLGDAEGNNRDGIIYNRRVYSVAGSAKIRKYRTGTEIGLQGAVIGLYDNDGEPLLDNEGKQITITTGENGEVDIPSLEYGTYKYKEIEAPEGYILDSTMYSLKVNGDGSITFLGDRYGNNTTGII